MGEGKGGESERKREMQREKGDEEERGSRRSFTF